jgi:hypothetical protein
MILSVLLFGKQNTSVKTLITVCCIFIPPRNEVLKEVILDFVCPSIHWSKDKFSGKYWSCIPLNKSDNSFLNIFHMNGKCSPAIFFKIFLNIQQIYGHFSHYPIFPTKGTSPVRTVPCNLAQFITESQLGLSMDCSTIVDGQIISWFWHMLSITIANLQESRGISCLFVQCGLSFWCADCFARSGKGRKVKLTNILILWIIRLWNETVKKRKWKMPISNNKK